VKGRPFFNRTSEFFFPYLRKSLDQFLLNRRGICGNVREDMFSRDLCGLLILNGNFYSGLLQARLLFIFLGHYGGES